MARRLRSQHRRRAADQIRPRPHREPAQRCQGSPHQEQTTGNYRLISPCASARGPRRMDTQQRGIDELVGEVLPENAAMLRLCRELGFTIGIDPRDPKLRRVSKTLMTCGALAPG